MQDAWAIIQHHLVYKREAQVPTPLQRKLNSLAGLFETVDDQFETIRKEREAYLVEVRDSSHDQSFLENELNLDTFKEYLAKTFPLRSFESFEGQGRMALDGLFKAGYKTLRAVDELLKNTAKSRAQLIELMVNAKSQQLKADDGTIPSNVEAAAALALAHDNWEDLILWGETLREIIADFRKIQNHAL